jgi:hypothetical protein
MCVGSLWRACGAPLAPLRGIPHAACSETAPFLACSLARLLSFPRYPPSLPSPPTPSVHAHHFLSSAAFPAIPHAPRCRSTPPPQLTSSLFLPSSLARSIACSPAFSRYPSSLPRPPTLWGGDRSCHLHGQPREPLNCLKALQKPGRKGKNQYAKYEKHYVEYAMKYADSLQNMRHWNSVTVTLQHTVKKRAALQWVDTQGKMAR